MNTRGAKMFILCILVEILPSIKEIAKKTEAEGVKEALLRFCEFVHVVTEPDKKQSLLEGLMRWALSEKIPNYISQKKNYSELLAEAKKIIGG